MKLITGRNNPLIVRYSKLKDRKHREKENLFLFEGIKLLREARMANIPLVNVFMTEKSAALYPDIANECDVTLISDSVCEKLSENSSPDGIICIAEYADTVKKDISRVSQEDLSSVGLILSSVRDPGNLGTIIRTSAAFGKKSIIMSRDCADIYNQKTIRASMGAIFKTDIFVSDDLIATVKNLKEKGVSVYAAALNKKAEIPQNITHKEKNTCFVLGNEGQGLEKDLIDSCSGTVFIPMEKTTESLNVSIAAAVLLWETYR